MHFIYILHSEKTKNYYIGETDNVELRLYKHNKHLYKGSFTKTADDWEVKMIFKCITRKQALQLERFIKKMKSKIFINKLIENPEILQDIISRNNF